MSESGPQVVVSSADGRKLFRLGYAEIVLLVGGIVGGAAAWTQLNNRVEAAEKSIGEVRESEGKAEERSRAAESALKIDVEARLGRMERVMERMESKLDQKPDREELRDRLSKR